MNENLDDENRCYSRIIDCYMKHRDDTYRKQMCKNRSIVKLMNILKSRQDKSLVKNALLITLSLFGDELSPADYLTCLGRDLNSLEDKEERNLIISNLKKEFVN